MSAPAVPPGDARYLALTTFRRDGREVTTPVWVVHLRDRLYVGTTTDTGKVKRIRANGRVRYAPCNASGRKLLGPWHEGRARLVEDPELRRAFMEHLAHKYGWQLTLVKLIYRLRGTYRNRCVLEIEESAAAAA